MTPLPATSKYLRMNAEELAAATAEFDREMVISQSRALASSERRTWQEARRKPGRPRRGAGVKVISVSVERGLLSRSDALASRLGVSRAALIERGLRLVLAGRLGGLSATRAEVPVAEAQRAELDRRSRALDRALARGQNPGEPADEVVRRIRARR